MSEETNNEINEVVEPKGISFDDYLKVDFMAGTIKEVERVPKSKKLLKMQVNFGESSRQIVTNIGDQFEPESLLGVKTIFVSNLLPAVIMGIESNGMIYCARDVDNKAVIIRLGEDVLNGSKVG